MIKLKNNSNTILNSFRYNLKQNASEVYQDNNLTIKCSPTNPITNVDYLYFLDKKGNKFSYFLDDIFFASFSSRLNKVYHLNTNDVKVKDLKLSCFQRNIYTPPIITISFKVENMRSLFIENLQEFTFSTKVKLTNF